MQTSRVVVFLSAVMVGTGCAGVGDDDSVELNCDDGQCDVGAAQALCEVKLRARSEAPSHGPMTVAHDRYLEKVIGCEAAADSPLETLKAQAVAARSYMHYVVRSERRTLKDGQGDQDHGCGRESGFSAEYKARIAQAVAETRGQIVTYNDQYVAAFYVAGAFQSAPSCTGGSKDPTRTERHVTYNSGKSGSSITQTSLGWKNKKNWANRGCMSQNGAVCLSETGKNYVDILRFYYGEDINLQTLGGPCGGDGSGIPPGTDPGNNGTFVGSPCEGGAEICDFVANGEVGSCLEWVDEDSDENQGFCSLSCSGSCPDADGFALTVCADVNATTGMCVPTVSNLNSNCDDIPGAAIKVVRRHMSTNTAVMTVCAPPYTEGISCSAGGGSGECIDTDYVSCSGQIHVGACPGDSSIRCCTD